MVTSTMPCRRASSLPTQTSRCHRSRSQREKRRRVSRTHRGAAVELQGVDAKVQAVALAHHVGGQRQALVRLARTVDVDGQKGLGRRWELRLTRMLAVARAVARVPDHGDSRGSQEKRAAARAPTTPQGAEEVRAGGQNLLFALCLLPGSSLRGRRDSVFDNPAWHSRHGNRKR